jgi:hypothetical protein
VGCGFAADLVRFLVVCEERNVEDWLDYCCQYLWHARPLGLALDPTPPLLLPSRLLYPFALHRLFRSGVPRTLPMDVDVIPRKPKCKRRGRRHVAGVFFLLEMCCVSLSPSVIQYSTLY